MVEAHKNIFAVGDDDQSIYGWRGADITNILNFKIDFPDSIVVKFERNYRSTPNILLAANNIFKDKDISIRKVLKVSGRKNQGRLGLGDKIIIYQAADDVEEAEFCQYIISETSMKMRGQIFETAKKNFDLNYPYYYHSADKMLKEYNKISNYSMQLWTKTLEWVNAFNETSNADGIDKIHKFLLTFFEFNQMFHSLADKSQEEKQALESFFESLYDRAGELFKISAIYRKFAVFYRINSQKEVFKEVFGKKEIPYIEVGNNQLFEFREIRNIITLFKIITDYIQIKFFMNFPPDFSFLNADISEIAQLPKFKISDKDKTVFLYCPDNTYLLSPEYISALKINIGQNAYTFIVSLYNLCEQICFKYSENTLNFVLQKVIEYLDYSNILYNDSSTGRQLKRNIDNFKLLMLDYERQYSKNNSNIFYNFRKYIVYRSSDTQSSNAYNDGVYLMTLHSSKGLEFENVFFTGLEEEVCPYKWPGLNKIGEAELAEEKRLFYVGVTRAQKRLYLTYAQKRKWFGRDVKNKPSRFLKHIPEDLIEK